jgi:hypothetical protein
MNDAFFVDSFLETSTESVSLLHLRKQSRCVREAYDLFRDRDFFVLFLFEFELKYDAADPKLSLFFAIDLART